MSNLSEKVSKILDFRIPEGQWKQNISRIDNAGEPTRIHATAILFALCEEVEELEQAVKDLQKGK